MSKTIVVACATGVVTSTVIIQRIEKICKEAGIAIDIIQCKVPELTHYADRADLIVTSGKTPKKFDVPTVRATPYITGVAPENTDAQILECLKQS